jgi:predicted nuclease with TOPRIM domain
LPTFEDVKQKEIKEFQLKYPKEQNKNESLSQTEQNLKIIIEENSKELKQLQTENSTLKTKYLIYSR